MELDDVATAWDYCVEDGEPAGKLGTEYSQRSAGGRDGIDVHRCSNQDTLNKTNAHAVTSRYWAICRQVLHIYIPSTFSRST